MVSGYIFRNIKRFVVAILVLFIFCVLPVFAQDHKLPFLENESIDDIREKIRLNGYSFAVKENAITRLATEDRDKLLTRRRRMPGVVLQESEIKPLKLSRPRIASLPSSFDIRNVGGKSYIGPIRNQGSLGSCYAFAASAVAEANFNFATNRHSSLRSKFSESYIAWSLGSLSPYSSHFSGGDGADYDYYELEALTDPGQNTGKEGICSETDFPYQISNISSAMIADSFLAPRTKYDAWSRVYPDDYNATTEEIKNAIYTYGAVDAAVYVTAAFDAYASGVYEDTNNTYTTSPYYYTTSNHAIALVGWDDNPPEGGGGVWILRNSWDSDWGEGGYMRIRYHSARVNTSAAFLIYENQLPIIETGDATDVTTTSANIPATINPNGDATSYRVEYSPDSSFNMASNSFSLTASSDDEEVTVPLTNLLPAVTYAYRVVAQNSQGEQVGEVKNFETGAVNVAPLIISVDSEDLRSSKAKLTAKINPRGKSTSWHLEYGLSSDSLTSTSAATLSADTQPHEVSVQITGLSSGRTYYYRAVAVNASGTTYGGISSFATPVPIISESFESSSFPSSWSQSMLTKTGSVTPVWSVSTGLSFSDPEPDASPYDGSRVLKITTSGDTYGDEVRLISPVINLSGVKSSRVSFKLYHDTVLGNRDWVRVQVSVDGSNWVNVAEPCYRYSGTSEWSDCEADLSYYDGHQAVYVAILGHGDGGGAMIIDDFNVSGESSLNISGSITAGNIDGTVVSLTGVTYQTTNVNADGSYQFIDLPPGTYTITPSNIGLNFTPSTQQVEVSDASVVGVNFTGEAISCTSSVAFDSDGDGVNNDEEVNAGTSPCDKGSFRATLQSPAYVKYNTFLAQQNYLELVSSGTKAATVKVGIYDASGKKLGTKTLTLKPNYQLDLDINSWINKSNVSGRIKIEFNDSDPEIQISGRLSLYRENSDGYAFVFAKELGNLYRGVGYVLANSQSPQVGSNAAVPNWIEIFNPAASTKKFNIKYYNTSGTAIYNYQARKGRLLAVGAGKTVDVQGGHELGAKPFLIEIIPEDLDTEYLAGNVRYGEIGTDDYRFATYSALRSGSGQKQYLPLATSEGSCWQEVNYVEIANTGSLATNVTLRYRAPGGEALANKTVYLKAKSQLHIDASSVIGRNALGVVEISASKPNSVLAQSGHYFYGCSDNTLQTAYSLSGLMPAGDMQVGSFNGFLNQENRLTIFNVATSNASTVLTVKPVNKSAINKSIVVGAKRTQGKNITPSTQYPTAINAVGVIKIAATKSKTTAVNLRYREYPAGNIDYVLPTVMH